MLISLMVQHQRIFFRPVVVQYIKRNTCMIVIVFRIEISVIQTCLKIHVTMSVKLYKINVFNCIKCMHLCILYHWPEDDPLRSKNIATLKI
jgi:hypothetical protein